MGSLYKDLVHKLKLEGGYLILDDTILEKHTLGLEGIRKLLDTKTGGVPPGFERGVAVLE